MRSISKAWSAWTVLAALAWVAAPVVAHGQFTEDTSANLTGVFGSSAAWGDYDSDGDLDILLTGDTGSGYVSTVYRNNGDGTFTDIAASLTAVASSSVAWGDYDNDGDLDILLTGDTGSGYVSEVYRNNGDGTFTDIAASLTAVASSSVAWGDYDNDGDLDILLTGDTGSGYVSEVYRNNGDGTFTDIAASLTAVASSSVAWGDYDNDGDLDILLTGDTGSGYVSEVYRNNGDETFTDIAAGLTAVTASSAAWGDYDNDGDLDILLTGDTGSGYVSEVYRNNGDETFTDIAAGLTAVTASSAAWGDYDNDGDLDILLTGYDAGINRVSKVYRNNGDGTFTDIAASLTAVASSSVAWGDYDNDGDLDVVLTGADAGSNGVSKVYRNDLPPVLANTFTDVAAGLTGVDLGRVAWGDYDNDGDLDILLTGFAAGAIAVSKVYRNNGDGTFTDIAAGLPGLYISGAMWGDFDNDGDLDILLVGDMSDTRVAGIYRNNGDNTFTETMGTGLTGVLYGNVACGDYDHDGDLDILLAGFDATVTLVSTVYRNNGDGTFTDIAAGLPGVSASSVAWGDYDHDGDLDILLAGFGAGSAPVSNVYRNNGDETFTDIAAGLTAVTASSAAWGDYDNDGNLDILLAGIDAGDTRLAKVYRNNGDGSFTDITAGLTGVQDSSMVWGDYDNDGDLDILLTGSVSSSEADAIAKVYRNNGDGTFTDIAAGLTEVAYSNVAWGDYDNDGDLDVLLTGLDVGSNGVSKVYRNDNVRAPSFAVNDVTLDEGNSGTTSFTFTVTRDHNQSEAWVDAATTNVSAMAGNDYTAVTATTLHFTAGGALSQQVTVDVVGDLSEEPDETFHLNLANPVDAVLGDSQGLGTILNDDIPPSMTTQPQRSGCLRGDRRRVLGGGCRFPGTNSAVAGGQRQRVCGHPRCDLNDSDGLRARREPKREPLPGRVLERGQ